MLISKTISITLHCITFAAAHFIQAEQYFTERKTTFRTIPNLMSVLDTVLHIRS